MGEADQVIVPAIEKLGNFLLKKADLRDDEREKLSSLVVEKADLRSVVVAMAELLEDNKEMLYRLLVKVADPFNLEEDEEEERVMNIEETNSSEEEEEEKERVMNIEETNSSEEEEEEAYSLEEYEEETVEEKEERVKKKKVSRLVFEMANLWEDDDRESIYKESIYKLKLEILLFDMIGTHDWDEEEEEEGVYEKLYSLAIEMAKDGKGELRKEKLYSWLDKKAGLWDQKSLFDLLHDVTRLEMAVDEEEEQVELVDEEEVEFRMKDVLKKVEEAKTDLVIILGIVRNTDKSEDLRYFISDAVEMAHDASLLITVMDSDLFIFLLEIFNCFFIQQLSPEYKEHPFTKFLREIMSIRKWLKETKERMEKFIQMQADILGSRLLFTTRDEDKRWIYGNGIAHKMKYIDDDKCWQLLLKTALYGSNDDEKFPKQLERRGREMLRKCGGLPLAIKEMGRQWAEKRRSGSEWEQIVESSMDLVLPETLAALESTYLRLDSETKSCFLRLAFFKEGTPIRANKLEQILAASNEQNEYIKWCLVNLRHESIIKVKEMTTLNSTRAKTYRINDVFHMLSITKAEDEIRLETQKKDGNNNRAASHEPRHRRVIHCGRDNKFNFNYSSMNQDKHLLSLFFYGGGFSDIATPSYWNHFEQLKILDIEGFGLMILPDTVGELTELIYLGLRNNYIQELSRSLGHLKKLEVLDIALNFMVAVPDIIWEMDSLKHLYMSDIICQKPLKIDALRNLQTLTYISVDNWTYELLGLKMMTALRKLGIEEVDENTDVSKLFASLAELDNIDSYSLILRGFRFRSLPSLDGLGILHNVRELKLEGRLTRLPTANNFPPRLEHLALVNSGLDEDPMPILEKLPKLECLHLQNAYTGQQMVISPYGLRELRELVIKELWHLRNLQVGRHSLKRLCRLEINSCPYLGTPPEEIYQTLDNYSELKIVTTKNIATKIRESGFISRIEKVDIQP